MVEQNQKFFIIFQINNFYLGKASLKYAKEVMHALKQAEGRLMFSVKRAHIREVVYRQTKIALFNSSPLAVRWKKWPSRDATKGVYAKL